MEKNERKKKVLEFIKFMLFMAGAGIIQIVTFTIMNELLHFRVWLSIFLSVLFSVIFSFTLNRKFTFKEANNVIIAMIEVALYYVVFTPLSTIFSDYMETKMNEYLILAIVMFTNLVTEYLYNKFFVYRKRKKPEIECKPNTEIDEETIKSENIGN
ncbi:MAG: GtrA family protein [Acholeplasmatales bacterium]|jgi:putative flippase GtrA|nr:GtrA family protein [Acholeplasmatales bacterium]